jgi:hypothetical protein
MRRIALPLVLLCSLSAGSALAAGPQKGRYQCWFTNGFFAADLHIVSATKYRIEKESGKYVVDGKRLRFKSGPHKGQWKSVKWNTGPNTKGQMKTEIDFVPKNSGGLMQCVHV